MFLMGLQHQGLENPFVSTFSLAAASAYFHQHKTTARLTPSFLTLLQSKCWCADT